jgi:hypothetical protein
MGHGMMGKIVAAIGAGIGIALFFRFPDLDIPLLGIGAHRNFLFHSVALVAALFLAVRKLDARRGVNVFVMSVVAGCGIGIGLHLFADMFQSHPVKFPFVGSLVDGTSVDDRLWLGLNSIGSLLLSVGIFRRLKLALISKRGGT